MIRFAGILIAVALVTGCAVEEESNVKYDNGKGDNGSSDNRTPQQKVSESARIEGFQIVVNELANLQNSFTKALNVPMAGTRTTEGPNGCISYFSTGGEPFLKATYRDCKNGTSVLTAGTEVFETEVDSKRIVISGIYTLRIVDDRLLPKEQEFQVYRKVHIMNPGATVAGVTPYVFELPRWEIVPVALPQPANRSNSWVLKGDGVLSVKDSKVVGLTNTQLVLISTFTTTPKSNPKTAEKPASPNKKYETILTIVPETAVTFETKDNCPIPVGAFAWSTKYSDNRSLADIKITTTKDDGIVLNKDEKVAWPACSPVPIAPKPELGF